MLAYYFQCYWPSNLVFVVTYTPNLRKIGQKPRSLSWTIGIVDKHTHTYSQTLKSVNWYCTCPVPVRYFATLCTRWLIVKEYYASMCCKNLISVTCLLLLLLPFRLSCLVRSSESRTHGKHPCQTSLQADRI